MKLFKTITVGTICCMLVTMPLLLKKINVQKESVTSENVQMRVCPLCNNSSSTVHMKATAWNNRHGVELKKCSACSFVFSAVSSFDYASFSAQEQFPTQTRIELMACAQQEHLPELIAEIVQKTGLTSGKALDFGCGIGLNSLCLQNEGFTTYGVELSNVYLQKHPELGIISAKTVETLDVEPESFDLIIMKDVLEHVDHPVQVLEEVLAYLKPGGYLYIRVPNVHHYYFHWSIDTQSHVNHFSPHHLMQLLEKNGLQMVDFVGVYDISTKVGKLYNFIFWNLRNYLPLYHQISLLYQKC